MAITNKKGGIKPEQKQNNKSGYGYYIYNGVDRINNNL